MRAASAARNDAWRSAAPRTGDADDGAAAGLALPPDPGAAPGANAMARALEPAAVDDEMRDVDAPPAGRERSGLKPALSASGASPSAPPAAAVALSSPPPPPPPPPAAAAARGRPTFCRAWRRRRMSKAAAATPATTARPPPAAPAMSPMPAPPASAAAAAGGAPSAAGDGAGALGVADGDAPKDSDAVGDELPPAPPPPPAVGVGGVCAPGDGAAEAGGDADGDDDADAGVLSLKKASTVGETCVVALGDAPSLSVAVSLADADTGDGASSV